MEIDLAVNPAYWQALDAEQRYLVLVGGAGSGKSYFAADKVLLRTVSEVGHRFLVVRKVARTLRNSVYQLLRDEIARLGLSSEFVIHKSEMRFTFKPNGNEILLAGIDDPEKIKSIQGITGLWVEEASELTREDLTQLDLRLRGELPHYKQVVMSLNPIDERHHIKTAYCDEPHADTAVVKTTYRDNVFIDAEYVATLEGRMKANDNLYRIYVLGEWGRDVTGGEFYRAFRYTKHVVPCAYRPELPLHLTWDFNVLPYVTCCVWQVEDDHARQIDEICLPWPQNRTVEACNEFRLRYPDHEAGVFIYGDPAGKQADTRSTQGHNDYKIILGELSDYAPQTRLSASAPPVHMRGMWINGILGTGLDDISISIDPKCEQTINDYISVKESAEGTKLKVKAKHSTGASYEAVGHTSDANDYFLTSYFQDRFRAFKRGPKRERREPKARTEAAPTRLLAPATYAPSPTRTPSKYRF